MHISVKKEPEESKSFVKAPDGYLLPALVMLRCASANTETPSLAEETAENKVRRKRW